MFRLFRATPGRLGASVAVVAAMVAGVGGATAQDDVGDLRDQREDNRRDAAEVAAQIDALSAEDEELAGALAAIDAHISLQEAKVETALVAIAAAETEAAQARARAAGIAEEISVVRTRLQERAVEAFVGPRSEALDGLDTGDLMKATIRRSLFDQVVGDEYELVDQLRTKVAQQDAEERTAVDLLDEVQRERDRLDERLAELEAARAEADELRDQVQGRISEWQAAGVELEEADRAIADEIRRLEAEAARLAAEEEARRLAEEEARRLAEEEEARRAEDATDDGDDSTDADTEDEGAAPALEGDLVITHRPVPGYVVSSFGDRVHPIFGTVRTHFGLDLDGDRGDPVVAAASGVVLTSGWMNGYGNTVIISHGGGFTTVYAHLNDVSIQKGDSVDGGGLIGWVGSTGWSTGPHLHFEVRVEGTAVDPRPYLP